MEGGTVETQKGQLAAPCGLYCGVCAIYIAHRDDNLKFKERLTGLYGVGMDDLHCKGCLSDDVFLYCRVCPIKACTAQKGIAGCHQCADFPCGHIAPFPSPSAKGSSSAPFPPGGSWEPIAGWRRRRSATAAPAAETPFSEGQSAAGVAARRRIWIEGGHDRGDPREGRMRPRRFHLPPLSRHGSRVLE
jgi:hypothetical protein